MSTTVATRILLFIYLLGIILLAHNSSVAENELTSPLIPLSTRSAIIKPIIVGIIVSSISFFAAAAFHFFSKNTVSNCISAAGIIYMLCFVNHYKSTRGTIFLKMITPPTRQINDSARTAALFPIQSLFSATQIELPAMFDTLSPITEQKQIQDRDSINSEIDIGVVPVKA